jgi:cytidylate kinase
MTPEPLNHFTPEEEPLPKPFIIGITNDVHGAGSTTTAKHLTHLFEFCYQDPGNAIRQMAVDQGYATDPEDDEGVLRFEKEVVSKEPNIDIKLDAAVISKALEGNCVIEGTAAVILTKAGLIPSDQQFSMTETAIPVFTALLTCDEKVAAQRALLRKKLRRQGIDPLSSSPTLHQQIIQTLAEEDIRAQMDLSHQRKETTRQNWERLYRLSALEKGRGAFDLPPIDTTNLTPEQVVEKVIIALADKSLISQEKAAEAKTKLSKLLSSTQNPH